MCNRLEGMCRPPTMATNQAIHVAALRPAASLATADSPPLSLPGSFFVAAMLSFVPGALGLVWVAPGLAAGAFYVPAVIAVTHLFTLGFLTLTAIGALCQFLPVAVGTPLRWPSLARWTLGLVALGLVLFELGFLASLTTALEVGAGALASGLLLFAFNLLATLARARMRDTTWWALLGAALCLLVTLAWGFALALDRTRGFVPDRFEAVFVHAHIALFGWLGLVMIAVAGHLQPMFLVVHGVPRTIAAAAVALILSGVALAVLPLGREADAAGLALMEAGMFAFLLQSARHYRSRLKRKLGPGLALATAGLFVLALALPLAPYAAWSGLEAPRWPLAYLLLVLGGIGLFVAGHYYKIVPFLVWFHRFAPFVGERAVPNVAEMFSARVAWVPAVVLPIGLVAMASSVLLGSPAGVRAGALAFAAGAVVEALQLSALARRTTA